MTLLLMGSLCAHAQKKFVKVDVADFKTTVCAIDSSAAAEYIYRIGETEYYYAEGHFYIKTELKTRIRVLKDDGKDAANVAIRYYYNSKTPRYRERPHTKSVGNGIQSCRRQGGKDFDAVEIRL